MNQFPMMAKDQSISLSLKGTIYKLQLSLLQGLQNEDLLSAAGSLMSRSDYQDVVTERSIANLCGYPLCTNSPSPHHPHKGRYRISLKEHKVYDLNETYMYCSSACLVKSRAFAGSLQEERCTVVNPVKLNEVLKSFQNLHLDAEDLGNNEDFGLSNLRIQEKEDTKVGEVSLEQWIGPSNAIEGYVPQRDCDSKPLPLKNRAEGLRTNHTKTSGRKESSFSDMDFMSTIITSDEYCISKTPSITSSSASDTKLQEQKSDGPRNDSKALSLPQTSRKSKGEKSNTDIKDVPRNQEHTAPLHAHQTNADMRSVEAKYKTEAEKTVKLNQPILKPSLKSSASKKYNRSVTWADEKVDSAGSGDLCEIRNSVSTYAGLENLDSKGTGDDGSLLRVESAEACAMALSQAAEAVASGHADVTDAISEAGVILLPCPHDLDQVDSSGDLGMLNPESSPIKWPSKPGIPCSDYFDPEDSWFDGPPEGFSLSLSPFATMWMALFAWVTSCSLAYIYGRDESSHEDYILVNGREYPRKIVLRDGRSSEIKQTVGGFLARVCPGLVADLRLPIPISTLEQGMGHLLDTMSFIDALPAFRTKQWQVIALLFFEALSVCRIPALTSHLTNNRMVLQKVLDGAQITAEEYEVMKDLVIPLGRAPQFSAQSGA